VAGSIFQTLSDFFARYGYWAVFFGVLLENVGVPVPGETVLLFAAFLAYQGKMEIFPAMATALAGATLGASLGFAIGRYGGATLVTRILKSFPRIERQYDSAQKLFTQHGQWAVFAARFVTGLRVFAGILAGVLRMPFPIFLFYTFAGAACWALAIGCVGFVFGSSWSRLVAMLGRLDRIALLAILACILILLLVNWARRRKTP
jgi:membrane protein DedA with SNARE-associated domain